MAARTLAFITLLLAQDRPTIHYLTEGRSRSPTTWVGVAWRHAPHLREAGEVLTLCLALEARQMPFAAQAESLGIRVHTWSGPEGAAITVTVPRTHLLAAADWLYSLLTRVPHAPNHTWHAALRQYQRRWEGFSLEWELFWRIAGPSAPPGRLVWDSAAAYIERYLRSGALLMLVGSPASFREKVALGRMRPPLIAAPAPPHSPLTDTLPADTTEENLWAYPAYAALRIELPEPWGERIAFLQAFLSRWLREAPPLRWQGRFWGGRTYLLQARLDGQSHRFLRNLTQLTPRDSTELQTWQAAYALTRQQILAHPEAHPDIWIGALLRGDTLLLPDTLPVEIWQRGWHFTARGIWLESEWLAVDTLLQHPLPPDTVPATATPAPVPAPDYLWMGTGEPPLAEWASALQLFWGGEPTPPCELIGYYRRRKEYNARLKALHALRRRLIQQYSIPPEALRVTLRPVPPDLPVKALRLKCGA